MEIDDGAYKIAREIKNFNRWKILTFFIKIRRQKEIVFLIEKVGFEEKSIDKDLEWFVKSQILEKHGYEFSYKPEPDKEKEIEQFINKYYPDIDEKNRV